MFVARLGLRVILTITTLDDIAIHKARINDPKNEIPSQKKIGVPSNTPRTTCVGTPHRSVFCSLLIRFRSNSIPTSNNSNTTPISASKAS